MRYYEHFTLDPGPGGTVASYQFSANGLFDPRSATGGHQPRGFDQYMAMYDHAIVKSSTARVYFDNNAEASGMLGVLHVRDTTSPFTAQNDVMEYGMKSVALLNSAGASVNVSRPTTATIKVDIAKFLGVDSVLDNENLKNNIVANAAEDVVFHVSAFPINAGDAAVINCAIEIEYEVYFVEPKNPIAS